MTVTSKLPSKYRKKQGDRKETEKRTEGRILWGLRQRLDELSGGCAQRSAAESEGGRLSAQGSGLCARQAKGSSHAPEIPTPTPAVDLTLMRDDVYLYSQHHLVRETLVCIRKTATRHKRGE